MSYRIKYNRKENKKITKIIKPIKNINDNPCPIKMINYLNFFAFILYIKLTL